MNEERIGMAGEKLGDYFNVDAACLGNTEYYVPFDAIANVTEDAVRLNIRKDQIKSMGWDQRPSETSMRDTTGMRGTTDTDRTMQLREEELHARTTQVEKGRVHLGKDVVEEERTLEVPVTREEVYVERHPVDRRPTDQPISETDTQTIRVPVNEERVEVEKQPVVYEEVGVGKRVTQDTRQVSDTVRREELRTDKEGDVDAPETTER